MILNERILGAVVTLAEELHFGRAAAKLHVSQPALSGTIKNLERDLGVRLFHRSSRHVELTKGGHILVAEAHRLMAEAERAIALVRATSCDILGPLRIGYPACIDVGWLASLISHSRHDPVLANRLELVSAEAVELFQDLIKGSLHVGVFPGRPRHPDLVCVRLFREPLLAAMGAAHPLSHCTSLKLEQLNEEPVVWLRRDLNPLAYESFLECCGARQYHPHIVQEVRTFFECLQFARKGLGITFVPASFRPAHEAASGCFAEILEGGPFVEYTLAYRGDRDSESIERFLRFVQERLPDLPGHPLPMSIDRPKQMIGRPRDRSLF